MTSLPSPQIPRIYLTLANNVFEIERKLALHGDVGRVLRNVEKLKEALADAGLFYEDPTGQPFNETRTDIEATITGTSTENLVVVEVIRPIIRFGLRDLSRVVQKGVVVVQSRECDGA